MNPGWHYRLWTDQECRSFVRDRYPGLLSLYDSYGSNVSRADVARYLLLHHYSGLYADLDAECLRPLDGLLHGSPGCITSDASHGCMPSVSTAAPGSPATL